MKKKFNQCILVMLFITISLQVKALRSFDGDIKNNSLAISPNETIAVACYIDSVKVKVYNIKTGKVIKNISGFINPRNIIFSPDGKIFYITDSGLGLLIAYNAFTLKVVKTCPVGYAAFGSATNKNGDLIFINKQGASTVTVIDLVSKSVKKIITGFAQPRQGVKLYRANTKLYVTNLAYDKIIEKDVVTLKIDTTTSGFNKIRAIDIAKDGNTLFAPNSSTNSIGVVNVVKGGIIKEISLGGNPSGASLSSDEKIHVSGNKMDNTLSVINTASLTNIKTITGFKEPRQAIVFSKKDKQVYVLKNDLTVNVVSLLKFSIIRTIQIK